MLLICIGTSHDPSPDLIFYSVIDNDDITINYILEPVSKVNEYRIKGVERIPL